MSSSYPVFSKSDVNGFWALLADNLANVIIITTLCLVVLEIPAATVFGTVLPGVGVSLVSGLLFYAWLAGKIAGKENRNDVTSLPYGISTPVMFVYTFLIMKPIAAKAIASGMSPADAGVLAWKAGLAATFVGGLIEMSGALTGPWLQKHLPRAGMLGTLAGIALVWIAAVPLAEIFENPLVGLVSMAIILVGLVALYRLPFGVPAGLAAILIGTVVSWATGGCELRLSEVGFNLPVPVIGPLAEGLSTLFSNPWILAIVIPAEVYNFIETMNNVESAAAAGDKYPVGVCQVADGAGTLLGAVFGSAFPTTVYIGHPGYKRLGARRGYALGTGLFFFFGAIFGLFAFLHGIIPVAAVAPMLVFIGIVMTAQAFSANPPAHGMAVAMAMLPHVSNLLISKWGSLATVLAGNGDIMFTEKVKAALKLQGAFVDGHAALSNGSIIIGLLWGSITAFFIDQRLLAAAYCSFAAAGLTLLGFIHSASLGLNVNAVFFGYLLIGAFSLFLYLLERRKAPAVNQKTLDSQ